MLCSYHSAPPFALSLSRIAIFPSEAPMHDSPQSHRILSSDTAALWLLGLAFTAVHFVAGARYGFHRDELLMAPAPRRKPPCLCRSERCQACWCECRATPEALANPSYRRQLSPVTALRDKLLISEALHQRDPGARDVIRVPTGRGRFARIPVAWHRRNHHIESV
jgi:hypothetical protein